MVVPENKPKMGCGPTSSPKEDLKIHHMETLVIKGDSGSVHISASGGTPGIWITDKDGKAVAGLIVQFGMPCFVGYRDQTADNPHGADMALYLSKDGPVVHYVHDDHCHTLDLTKIGGVHVASNVPKKV